MASLSFALWFSSVFRVFYVLRVWEFFRVIHLFDFLRYCWRLGWGVVLQRFLWLCHCSRFFVLVERMDPSCLAVVLVLQVVESFGFWWNPDCFLLRPCYPCQVFAMWGLRFYKKYGFMVISSWGLNYPLSEHVGIFPVRLVPTFHWVFSVYLILAIYLHSRLYPCGRNKRQGLDPFIFSIKDSLHIHKWHGTFYYRDTITYIITIPSSPCNNVVWCSGD